MGEELLTLPEHPSSSPGFSGVRVTRSLFYVCVSFVDRCLSICPVSFGHCVVLLRFTDSDYPLGIFKLFLQCNKLIIFVALFVFKYDAR